MGSFAASVFNLLLGWIRGLVSSLWELINSNQAREGLTWLGDNWLWLVIIIAVAGLAVDYVIWFIRWRPYYVWRSWWRRLTHKDREEDADRYEAPEAEEQLYYEAYPPEPVYEDEMDVYQQPVHPGLTETGIQESLGLQSQAEETPAAPVRQRRSRREQAPLQRVRSGITQMAQRIDFMGLSREDEETEDYSYMPPPPAFDKEEAFHKPVYPAYWKNREDTE